MKARCLMVLPLTALVCACGSSSERGQGEAPATPAATVAAVVTPTPEPSPSEPAVEQTLLGQWTPVGEKCVIRDDTGEVMDDMASMTIERDAISGYEWHCDLMPRIKGPRYSGTQICSAEGEESPPTVLSMELREDGKLVMIDDGTRRILRRCS